MAQFAQGIYLALDKGFAYLWELFDNTRNPHNGQVYSGFTENTENLKPYGPGEHLEMELRRPFGFKGENPDFVSA